MSSLPSASLVPPLAGMSLDRVSTLRKDAAWVAAQLRDPAARFVAASRDGVLIGAEDEARLHRLPGSPEIAPEDPAQAILLGVDAGTAIFAADLEGLAGATRDALTQSSREVALREAGTLLSQAEGGLAAGTVALLNWHRVHRFCANCGAATEIVEAGYARRCPRCGTHHFPRTDPAVIMLVAHDDQVLLGRRPGWPAGRHSVLAGFVSPGESLEEAVIREVREESGIECRDPRFVASQPWPFPSSLMLGFTATSQGGEPRNLDGELEAVRWFHRDDVIAALAGDESVVGLPPSVSIAHLLLEQWAGDDGRSG